MPGTFKIIVFCLALITSIHAYAADGATLVFKEGHVVYIDDGYTKLISAYRGLSGSNKSHEIFELSLNGSSFLINLAEVAIVCRDKCAGLNVSDPRKTTKPPPS